MDLFEDERGETGGNAPEFTVSEISGAVKRVIEGEFGRVRVRGEVGRVMRARTGHVYFDLKDDRNVIAAVSWKGQAARLTAQPEEGMEVIASGKLTTYGGQSKYQMIVDDLTPAGEGALMAMLERRKKALAAEGLFDEARKQPLPLLPEVIGVVTSPTGAVIRDILHRLRERFPRKVLVWPVAVQGPQCAAQVAAAIQGFNQLTPGGALPRPDLLIVARGGGSIEDLWGFNEEVVARAAAASDIPLISAVGHETDTTLIDYVSDKRAPTPTAAAEIAVPVRMELMGWLDQAGGRMVRALSTAVEGRGQRLRDLGRAMPRGEALLGPLRQRVDLGDARLGQAPAAALTRARGRLADPSGRLRPALLSARVDRGRAEVDALAGRLEAAWQRSLSRRSARLAEVAAPMQVGMLRARLTAAQRDVTGLTLRLAPALDRRIAQDRQRLTALSPQPAATRALRHSRDRLDRVSAGLRLRPALVDRDRDRIAHLAERLYERGTARLTAYGTELRGLSRLLNTLSHRETLRRGYAIVRADGQVATSVDSLRRAAQIEVELADGRTTLGSRPKRGKPSDPGSQGSLF